MAEEKASEIVQYLRDNKLNNSELEAILSTDSIETIEDLKEHYKEDDDVEATLKSVRKRTEKILGKFSAKIVEMTGVDYQYKAPRRTGKGAQNPQLDQAVGSNDPYLSPAESPRGRRKKKNKRQSSNTSIGSSGSASSNGSWNATQGRSPRGQPSKTGKEMRTESNASSASMMRQWLQMRGIFHKDLFDYLASHNYNAPDDLIDLTESTFDRIVREVRVNTFKEVNDQRKRNRVDKLLTKFEKEWRKYSGIRKTNMTKEQQEMWGYSPVSSARSSGAEDDDQGFFS